MFWKAWREWIFPPICSACKEVCETKWLCPACWEACAPPDPVGRCPHCFEEGEGMCKECRRSPELIFPRRFVFHQALAPHILVHAHPDSIASFAIRSWVQFDWPMPDAVIPMRGARRAAREFAEMLGVPFAPILRGKKCDAEAIDEDLALLLFDVVGDLEIAKRSVESVCEAFPKKGFLLSLFPYGNRSA